MPLVSSATGRIAMPIIAPKPQSIVADNIQKGQKLEIRPGEPVYIFIERRMGTGTNLEGLNKRTPFAIKHLDKTPPGVPGIRTMGDWYQVSVKPGAKVGTKDRIALVTRTVTQQPHVSEMKPFTLVAGAQRWF